MNKYLEKLAEAYPDLASYLADLNAENDRLKEGNNVTHIDSSNKTLIERISRKIIHEKGGGFTHYFVPDVSDKSVPLKGHVLVQTASNPSWTERLFHPLHSVFDGSKRRSARDSLILHHELLESDEFNNTILPRIQQDYLKGSLRQGYNAYGVSIKKDGKEIGVHNTLAVLMRESNRVRLSPDIKAFDLLRKWRKNSGESDLLFTLTGKHYGEEFSEEDLIKGRNYSSDGGAVK